MSGIMHNKYCDRHRAEHKECNHGSHNPHGHCTFDIWGPDRHTSINNVAFSAYAFRQQQVEDVIDMLAAADDPNDFSTQCFIYNTVGIDSDTFTNDEINYIEREVSHRRV